MTILFIGQFHLVIQLLEVNVSNGQIFSDRSFDVIGENEVYIKVQNMNSGCIDDTTFVIRSSRDT